MDLMKEYPTLTALMQGREPGSVKVRYPKWHPSSWIRPLRQRDNGGWTTVEQNGLVDSTADDGPWLIVSEDAPDKYRVIDGELCKIVPGAPPLLDPALDTLRLEIAARIYCAAICHPEHVVTDYDEFRSSCLEQADALIAEARK